MEKNQDSKLVAVKTFQKSSPISVRWAIELHREEMVRYGALFRFGRKFLIDPDQFWVWLKERGHKDAQES